MTFSATLQILSNQLYACGMRWTEATV